MDKGLAADSQLVIVDVGGTDRKNLMVHAQCFPSQQLASSPIYQVI
jgi:hypothetical protein